MGESPCLSSMAFIGNALETRRWSWWHPYLVWLGFQFPNCSKIIGTQQNEQRPSPVIWIFIPNLNVPSLWFLMAERVSCVWGVWCALLSKWLGCFSQPSVVIHLWRGFQNVRRYRVQCYFHMRGKDRMGSQWDGSPCGAWHHEPHCKSLGFSLISSSPWGNET